MLLKENNKIERIHHLDSLRGIAAVAVIFHHSTVCYKNINHLDGIFVIFGGSPVIFFFVLSGFVLGRAFKESNLSFKKITGFYIKRFFRLYPPAVASVIFSVIIFKIFKPINDYPGVGNWFILRVENLEKVHSAFDYCKEVVCIDSRLNAPLWTVYVELTCSLLIPYLIIANKNIKNRIYILAILALILGVYNMGLLKFTEIGYQYLFTFYLGILIYDYIPFIKKIPDVLTLNIMILLLILWLASIHLGWSSINFSIIMAFILLILIPCNLFKFKALLETSYMLLLGRLSFAIYLLHFPILIYLCSSIHFLHRNIFLLHYQLISSIILFVLTSIVTIIIALIFERVIERPFNYLGHLISSHITGGEKPH